MNCQETRGLLPEYGEDVVPVGRRGPLEAHLAGCADCRAAAEEAKNLDVLLRKAVRVPEPPAAFWKTLESRALQTSGRRGWILPGTIGAAAALLLGFGVFALTRPDPDPVPREDVAEAPPVVKPEPPRPPAPPPEATPPAPAPLPPPARSLGILPGDPGYLERLTDENIEVGLADTASDRVLGLIRAADGRLGDLRTALDIHDDAIAEDLATAFAMIVRQGIGSVLDDRGEGAEDLAAARLVAKSYAGEKMRALTALEPKTQGSVKTALHDALAAARDVANR